MSSQDLTSLRKMLFQDYYSISNIELHIEKRNKVNKSIFTLIKDEDEQIFESDELDVLLYGSTFHTSISPEGNWIMRSYKDNEKYYQDIEDLIDKDGSKRKNAYDRIINGEYKPSYDLEKKLKKFLLSKKRSNKKFEPLREDYFEILISQALIASEYSKMDAKLQSERVLYAKLSKITRKILSEAFQNRGNAVKIFLAYHKHVDFDLEDITRRIHTVKEYHHDLFNIFPKQEPIAVKVAGNTILDIYRRYCELSSHIINALRISIELHNGLEKVAPYKKFIDNVEIIKSYNEYAILVKEIDPRIRHSESHINTELDEKTGMVRITERKRGKRETLCEYHLNEISKMILSLDRDFFPAMKFTFLLFETTMFLRVFDSFEYKNSLLGISNLN